MFNWDLNFQVCLFLNFVITCVCVRAYVLILFHRKEFFPLQWCQGHTWGCGSTILYHSRCFCQVPLSLFLKISYIETPARRQLDRKRHDILATCEKIICIDIGYKSALNIYVPSKQAFTYLMITIEKLEKVVKYVPSQQ